MTDKIARISKLFDNVDALTDREKGILSICREEYSDSDTGPWTNKVAVKVRYLSVGSVTFTRKGKERTFAAGTLLRCKERGKKTTTMEVLANNRWEWFKADTASVDSVIGTRILPIPMKRKK